MDIWHPELSSLLSVTTLESFWLLNVPSQLLAVPRAWVPCYRLPAWASFLVLGGFCLLGITQPLGLVYLQASILCFESYLLLLEALNFCWRLVRSQTSLSRWGRNSLSVTLYKYQDEFSWVANLFFVSLTVPADFIIVIWDLRDREHFPFNANIL